MAGSTLSCDVPPVSIVPDTKDWTWVLQRACPDCGYDAAAVEPAAVAGLVRDNAGRWRELLEQPRVTERPSADRWSALEYACHVRDVHRLTDFRVGLMLTQDDPTFLNWDQDETAVDEHYGEQDPAAVADELAASAATVADLLERVDGDAWQRTGTRSDGARFTVESSARYALHDVVHHVHDVEAGFARLSADG